jgi:endonuclease YncB( thermonuclease family)
VNPHRLLAALLACLPAVPLAGLPGFAAADVDQVTGVAEVIDGDTLLIGETTIRLFGIDAPEAGQSCPRAKGGDWACGNRATEALGAMVEEREITCWIVGEDDYDRRLGTCHTAGPDGLEINERLVSDGYAWAFVRYSDVYAAAERAARDAGLGVWQAAATPPWEYRAVRWEVAEHQAPQGCPIKGKIAAGERIYNMPWSRWYGRAKVNEARGERWFCSEREALDAGWRAAKER